MSYYENIGKLADLKKRRELVETQAHALRDGIRHALPVDEDLDKINGEYVMQLAISLNEKCIELVGYDKKIEVLSRETGPNK